MKLKKKKNWLNVKFRFQKSRHPDRELERLNVRTGAIPDQNPAKPDSREANVVCLDQNWHSCRFGRRRRNFLFNRFGLRPTYCCSNLKNLVFFFSLSKFQLNVSPLIFFFLIDHSFADDFCWQIISFLPISAPHPPPKNKINVKIIFVI